MSDTEFSVETILRQQPEIYEDPKLLETIIAVFDFTQYLLDDDENLTKSANLNSKAREKLDERIEELYLHEDDPIL